MSLKPRQPVPTIEFDTVGGGHWSLAAQKPQNFTMVVFYRGLHCPVCRRYTSELNGMIGEFEKRGVSTVIASTDARERAEQAKSQWGLQLSTSPDRRIATIPQFARSPFVRRASNAASHDGS